MPEEAWRAVPGFPGYEVSDRGRVRSLQRGRPRILRPDRGNRGHLRVTLYRGGQRHVRWVHQLVLLAHEGEPIVLHADDDPTNNALGNLRWGTRTENAADAVRNGRRPRGERIGTAKLTPARVRAIRRRVEAGESYASIARRLGVSKAAVGAAARGETWSHV